MKEEKKEEKKWRVEGKGGGGRMKDRSHDISDEVERMRRGCGVRTDETQDLFCFER